MRRDWLCGVLLTTALLTACSSSAPSVRYPDHNGLPSSADIARDAGCTGKAKYDYFGHPDSDIEYKNNTSKCWIGPDKPEFQHIAVEVVAFASDSDRDTYVQDKILLNGRVRMVGRHFFLELTYFELKTPTGAEVARRVGGKIIEVSPH
jgi:hypothetical protein